MEGLGPILRRRSWFHGVSNECEVRLWYLDVAESECSAPVHLAPYEGKPFDERLDRSFLAARKLDVNTVGLNSGDGRRHQSSSCTWK